MDALQARRWIWWLCLLHLAADGVLGGRWLQFSLGYTAIVVHAEFGWLDGQGNLLALWVALGGGRLVVRLGVGLAALLAITALDRYLTDPPMACSG